ncbi:DUF6194 family protein [Marininema halotolerans]|uniref:DUF6194 domain-containing protein n=1 Tax=Marininema halotolerans TaxID=1155944 RepID=A0A1I6RK71_9BACL|nr:DUF6194 family protein [Marininema halotolerans]SFS65173.1 hypothetical protein SAMN05444972_105157 [Marininema halotolerans]
MNSADFETFVMALPNVQCVKNFGYSLFFVGDDHRLPFVSIAHSDNDFDNVSNLDREGVFRLNIGVSKATFNDLNSCLPDGEIDFSMVNVFLPHPHYASQHFVCILNPDGDHVVRTKQLIKEAHAIAESIHQRKKDRR